ncbi:MAG: YceI family protein [Spongiibacteraceae bacterium]
MHQLLVGLLCLFGTLTFAGELQPQSSSMSFVIDGPDGAGEVHYFRQLHGTLDKVGMALLTIPLAGIDTGAPERDKNVRSMLFDVAKFPNASFLALVDMSTIFGLAPGAQAQVPVKGRLTLHGKTVEVAGEVVVTALADGGLKVVSAQPVVVNTADFDLARGMKKLMSVGDTTINMAVPISFTLVFAP